MPAFGYDCPTIINGFIAETGRYINDVASKSIPYSPWLANTPRGEWTDGMGLVHNSIVWERTVPNDTDSDWTDTVLSDANIGACDFTAENIKFGQTTRSMRKQKRYFQTDDFCIEDLRDDFQIATFLGGVAKNLTGVSSYVWATRRRREYIRLCDHKITEGATIDLDATTFNFVTNPPTSRLTNGTLEQIYDYLYLNGIFVGGSIGMTGQGSPVFTLITDAVTSRDLIRSDPELRSDFRFAFEGMGEKSPLLSAYGESIAYNRYKHVIDYPQRFDVVGGVTVERHPYKAATAATVGYKQDLDPLYRWAAYQISVVHIPTVMKELVPRPISNMGGGFNFDPQKYMGEFGFKVIVDKKCNPLGNKGFFDALFMSASEPMETWHGFAIAHLNCLPKRLVKNCQNYS